MQTSIFRKIGILFLAFIGLIILDACNGIDCTCPEVEDFFDFQSMDYRTDDNEVAVNDRWTSFLLTEDIEFLGEVVPACNSSWLFNSAFACSCIEPGWEGLKFGIESFEIASDADFNTTTVAGTVLNDLFLVRNPQTGQEEFLSDVEDKTSLFLPEQELEFFLDVRPTEAATHTFTITLTKSNGETIIATSEPVTWEE